jgi:hypothetical protein
MKKRKIQKYISEVKKSPKAFLRIRKLQLIILVNNDIPKEDQMHHLAEVVTGWTFSKCHLKNTQAWYNQKENREDNIIIYGVDTDTLESINLKPGGKTVSYIGKLPIATCLGLCYDNENSLNFERINI